MSVSVTTFAAGFYRPRNLAFYQSNFFMTCFGGVYKINSNGGVTQLTLTGDTLSNPQGITVDSLGNLYVANYGNNTVSKLVLQLDGSYSCTNLTLTGNTLNGPYGITMDSGNFYVTNQNSTVSKLVLQLDGSYSCTNLNLTGTLNGPYGIMMDSGNLYVANNGNSTVSKIVLSGNNGIVTTFATGFSLPRNLAVYQQDLFMTSDQGVYKINSNGFVTQLTLTGGTLSSPRGIIVDSGNLYVVNYGSNKVSKLMPQLDGSYTSTYLTLTGNTLSGPQGIIIDSGNFYITNLTSSNISKLVPQLDGSYSCTNLNLTGPDALTNPYEITMDSGNFYVTNQNNVSKLVPQPGGSYSCTKLNLTGTLNNPVGITMESGDLYVANYGDGTVLKIVLSGTNGTVSTYVSGLFTPRDVVFNSDKYLYIANTSNSTVSKTTSASCFNHDTKILCLKECQEEYIPIQDLRKGDMVKTYLHGYRKIDLIGKGTVSNKALWNESMYRMVKTDTNGLFEDLIVTGGHGILVDEVRDAYEKFGIKYSEKIDDKFILLSAASDDFVKLTDNDIYTYYHLVPENDGDDNQRFGIWANGILSETPSKNQFLAHEYEDM